MTFNSIIGSRAEVWHGSAKKTSGGLTKTHLMKNKSGRIVSKKKHFSAKKDNRLVKAGFKTKKGHFGFVKDGSKKRGHGKKMRGGMPHSISSSADLSLDLQSLGSTGVQIYAGQHGGSPYGNNFAPEELSNAAPVGPASPAASHSNASHSDASSSNASPSNASPKQAGGRRRRHRSHKMRGGTTKPFADVSMNSPLNRALNA
jgi:hypothetical protein